MTNHLYTHIYSIMIITEVIIIVSIHSDNVYNIRYLNDFHYLCICAIYYFAIYYIIKQNVTKITNIYF